jgi:hypothetical protein
LELIAKINTDRAGILPTARFPCLAAKRVEYKHPSICRQQEMFATLARLMQ